jgi:hypothetical protein
MNALIKGHTHCSAKRCRATVVKNETFSVPYLPVRWRSSPYRTLMSCSSFAFQDLNPPVPVGRRAETSIAIIEYDVITRKTSEHSPLGDFPVMVIVAPLALNATVAVFDAKQPVLDHVADVPP